MKILFILLINVLSLYSITAYEVSEKIKNMSFEEYKEYVKSDEYKEYEASKNKPPETKKFKENNIRSIKKTEYVTKFEKGEIYDCEILILSQNGEHIQKNKRNLSLFDDQPNVTFEYGSKISYFTSRGQRSKFKYVKNADNGEIYISTKNSALMGVSTKTPTLTIQVENIAFTYQCRKYK